VARLEPEKGHPTLLEAWPRVLASVPNAHLLIVGEGSQRAALEAHAAVLGLMPRPQPVRGASGELMPSRASRRETESHGEFSGGPHLTFTGRREDMPAVTAALDVAVLPSYREAQGLSILEAMALSRPVVASAVGGIPEMVEDGVTGLLVMPHHPDLLADAIVTLLRNHPLADTLARAGHDLVYDRFCVEQMVRSIETIYDEAVAEERRLAG